MLTALLKELGYLDDSDEDGENEDSLKYNPLEKEWKYADEDDRLTV